MPKPHPHSSKKNRRNKNRPPPPPPSPDELIAMEEELLLINPSFKDPLPTEVVDAGGEQVGDGENRGDQQVDVEERQLSDAEEERRDFLVGQLLQRPRLPFSSVNHARLIARIGYRGVAYWKARQENAAEEEDAMIILRGERIATRLLRGGAGSQEEEEEEEEDEEEVEEK